MDELGIFLSATRLGGTPPLGTRIERGVLYALAFAAFVLSGAMVCVASVAVAVYFAVAMGHGAAAGAAAAAIVSAGIVVALLGFAAWLTRARPGGREIAKLGNGRSSVDVEALRPRSALDFAALVAAGVLAGIADRRAGD